MEALVSDNAISAYSRDRYKVPQNQSVYSGGDAFGYQSTQPPTNFEPVTLKSEPEDLKNATF